MFFVILVFTQIAITNAQGIPKPLIIAEGYTVREHYVNTSDGYILKLFNIPASLNSPEAANKTVVFLQHGIVCSAADWIIQGPGKSIAYLLADAGFDVWMGNERGNTFSRSHVSLDPNQPQFWNFSWHEMGVIDLPAMINYVLLETGQKDLHYIGHSQGTTSFFVMGAMRPEMNNKIRTMHAFAPVAFMSHAIAPLFRLPSFIVNLLRELLGYHEFLPTNGFLATLGRLLCFENSPLNVVGKIVVFTLFGGFDLPQMSDSLVPKLFANTPAGASIKQLIHYLQLAESGKFRPFEEGLLFKTNDPPADYNLSNVVAPVYLHYGANDFVGAPGDIPQLESQLANVKLTRKVPLTDFNHLDFFYATDADKLLYNEVIEIIKKN